MVEEDMASSGRVTIPFSDWPSMGNSNSLNGELCCVSSSSVFRAHR